ncbi:TPA: E3 Ubiquitin ligase [Trebouxia sp. C0004]
MRVYSLLQGTLNGSFGANQGEKSCFRFEHADVWSTESRGVPISEEAIDFNCVLASAAAKGDAQEVRWLLGHTPAGYSPHLQQGANLALFGSIIGGQHAACQLLLEWCNPNKEPMELPICTFRWMPDTTGRVNQEDVSFLGLAYEWCTIQGQKRLEQPGHYRQFNGVDRKLQSPQYLGLLQLLLEFNASPAKGVQGLFQAIALSADTAAIRQLLLHGLDANATLSDGNTLLHLLVMAPDIEWPSADEDDIAQARSRQIEVAVTFLIEKGASPLARNNQQKTPVDVCFPRFPSIKALLLDALQPRRSIGQQRVSTGLAVCSICMDRPSIMVLVPCGHLCICQECSHHARHSCPICRTATTNMVETYVS